MLKCILWRVDITRAIAYTNLIESNEKCKMGKDDIRYILYPWKAIRCETK